MLNFIICEDGVEFRGRMEKWIYNFMMNYDMGYKTYLFSGYDKSFEKVVKEDIGFKIFFLDIKTDTGTGMDAARMIREEYDDWSSVLIMVTSFGQYRYEALTSRLVLFDFINKLGNCEFEIKTTLTKVLKGYNTRHKCLHYEYNHTFYQIEYRHIVYIEKEPESKRCHIRTTLGDYTIPGTLNDVLAKLDDRFVKVHRSMIVNRDQVERFEVNKNRITFRNGDHSHLVSRDKKKELMKIA